MKLDPRSIPYRAAERVLRLGWPLLFVVASGTPTIGSIGPIGPVGPVVIALVVLGGLCVLVGWQVVVYKRFSYEVTADTLDIRSGVLSRREREIPLRRVQNVDSSRNVVQRALGIVDVSVETAGGGATEARLRYLSTGDARRLREDLRRRERDLDADDGTTDEEARVDRTPTELFAIRPRELVLFGLVSIDLRLLSLATVLLPLFGPPLASLMSSDGVPVGPAGVLVLAPASAAAFVLLSGLASGAFKAANYYDFRLSRADDDLRYERGLFQRSEGTIPVEKVQALAIKANVSARLAGYATLAVETAGYAPGQGSSGGSEAAVPLATRERCLTLARSIEPFEEPEFSRPPKRARTRYAVRYTALVCLLTGLAWAVTRLFDVTFAWYAVLALLVAVPVAAHLKWANRGYALGEGYVFTRNGVWTRTTTIVPDYRVQTVAETRTIFQRRRSLATLTVDTAGAGGSRVARAVDIDAETAAELRKDVSERLQRALAARRADRDRRADRASHGSTPAHPLAEDLIDPAFRTVGTVDDAPTDGGEHGDGNDSSEGDEHDSEDGHDASTDGDRGDDVGRNTDAPASNDVDSTDGADSDVTPSDRDGGEGTDDSDGDSSGSDGRE